MASGAREVIRESHPYAAGSAQSGCLDSMGGEETGTLTPARRREVRVKEQKLCTYALCESLDEEAVVIQQGEAYSLNRSAHGVMVLMGYEPRAQQLLELYLPESRRRRSMNLYEVQWTKPVHVDSQGDLYLVGCRLTFGAALY